MKAEIKQEQQLRLVTESCLNDERAIRHHITGVMRDMRMKCDEMKESLRNLTYVYYFILTCIIISYFSSIFFAELDIIVHVLLVPNRFTVSKNTRYMKISFIFRFIFCIYIYIQINIL